jgi:hypothetical protein
MLLHFVARSHAVLFAPMICLTLMFGPTQDSTAQAVQPIANDAVTPVSAILCNNMKLHHVLGPHAPVGCDRLKLVKFSYAGFDKALHDDGEIVVMDATATHVSDIFKALRNNRFPIAKAKLMNAYDGDDDASMADNNTSAFNDRKVADSASISLHAYGLAIDVNPVQNPYITRFDNGFRFHPPAGVEYANRMQDRPWKKFRPGMAEEIVDIFADNGFLVWGGYWDNPIDYQHFQVGRKMAERLAGATPVEAQSIFDGLIERYRNCRRESLGKAESSRTACIMKADPTAGASRN